MAVSELACTLFTIIVWVALASRKRSQLAYKMAFFSPLPADLLPVRSLRITAQLEEFKFVSVT